MTQTTDSKTNGVRRFRFAGLGTSDLALGDRRAELAVKAAAALRRSIGPDFRVQVSVDSVSAVIEKDSSEVQLNGRPVRVRGEYRVLGLQSVGRVCDCCGRPGSVKWGTSVACTTHASFEAVIWDKVRRVSTAAKQAAGDLRVSTVISPDPRLVVG